MKIDLHVHCRERSPCGKSSVEEQIEAAIRVGLDAIVFTDHDQLFPPDRLKLLNQQYAPFRILGGIEVGVNGEHVLVYGVQDPALESQHWSYPELHAMVRERGGLIAIAHPFRYRDTVELDLLRYPPDALELMSKNIALEDASRIRKLADEVGALLLWNSDAHAVQHVGLYYNELSGAPADEAELLELIRAGKYRGRRYSEAEPVLSRLTG